MRALSFLWYSIIDLFVITDEEPEPGCLDKPVEMFHIAEHFCLGQRRLHVFGRDSSIRPGKPHHIGINSRPK
jgi:hypothetical protein